MKQKIAVNKTNIKVLYSKFAIIKVILLYDTLLRLIIIKHVFIYINYISF